MDFDSLKTELSDRGFSDTTDSRRGIYINAGRAELDRMYLWPWRETSATGTAPLIVTDLGVIEMVTDETRSLPLEVAQYRDLANSFGDLTTDGNPQYYYVGRSSGSAVIATYPESSNSIGVQYWKRTPDLSVSSDDPASPDEAHLLIVDLAERQLRRRLGDAEGVAVLSADIERQIADLLQQYPPGAADGQGFTVVSTQFWV